MFSFDTKVRYSELNELGLVRPEAIVNFLQDCTTYHSNSVGADFEFFKREQKLWVLNSWQIEVKEQLKQDEEITVCTWPYDFSGAYGHRNFVIKDKSGKHLVEANTLWVFADMVTGRPIKLTEEYTKFYELSEKLDMNYMDRKVKVPVDVIGREMEPITIKKAYIDTNGHVNNGRYVECAAEYIPVGAQVKRIRAEYKMQAKYGKMFYPVVYEAEGEENSKLITVLLNDENGKTYASVEFDICM